jgi:choline dehydrogenase-like flavoprotein
VVHPFVRSLHPSISRPAKLRLPATLLRAPTDDAAPHDFVLVGGGTAGCVLADRLSSSGKRVLVLEPGPSPRGAPSICSPAGLLRLFFSKWDWGFKTPPREETAERALHLARGKALGGSSCFNALLYLRGTAADFDGWGVEEWGSEPLLREGFLRSENNRRRSLRVSSAYHSTKGAEASLHSHLTP